MNKLKTCTHCKEELSQTDYYRKCDTFDQLTSWCKQCINKRQHKWRQNNPKHNTQYHMTNKQQIAKRKKITNFVRYYHKNGYLKSRANMLKREYGITIEEYDTMLLEQNHVCWICQKPESFVSNKANGKVDCLRVDHNHYTGQVRGLLCSHCNFGLGHFRDDIKLLKEAIKYLKRNEK
jgi:rubrerythrin